MVRRAALLGFLVTGCVGDFRVGSGGVGTPTGPGPTSVGPSPSPVDPGAAPLRRLTHAQLDEALGDLVGSPKSFRAQLAAEFGDDGYTNQAQVQVPTQQLIDGYAAMAEEVAQALVADSTRRARVVPCVPQGFADVACLEAFVRSFGRRAFRRPLTDEELADFASLARTEAASTQDFWEGVRFVVEVVLQAPTFLYRSEGGVPDSTRPGLERLDDFAIASRLSFLLTNAPPDDALVSLAEAGGLSTREAVVAQAERLLASPRAKATLHEFHQQWFRIDQLDGITRDPAQFPTFSAELVRSMQEETTRVIDDAVWGGGDVMSMFDADSTYVDARLAQLYGVPAPSGSGFQRVTLPPERRGLLGQGSFLANSHKTQGTSPTARGLFVQVRMLCGTVPPPPPNVSTDDVKDMGVPRTTRDRFEQHATNPACASCHRLMDGTGFGLEKFDAIGAYRETEVGLPIDDRGEVVVHGVATPFTGGAELGAVLRALPETRQCYVKHLVRWALGRQVGVVDQGTLTELDGAFATSGNRFASLVKALVASDAFRYRHPEVTP